MFSKFQLMDISSCEFSEYLSAGQVFYEKYQTEFRTGLENFIDENGEIDGTKLQENWFPVQTEFDVFLSHSHDDERTAIALAGFLQEKLNLNTFVDSCLWGCSNDLLRKLDEKYCRFSDGTLFDYDKRNYSTSHVHMMLSIALSNMIDKCESVFLLNTPRSISLEENINKKQTGSPWIYNELSMSNIIRVRPIEDYRSQYTPLEHEGKLYHFADESAAININYDISKALQSFITLTSKDLRQCADDWKSNRKSFQNPLDYIYLSKEIISLCKYF